MKAPVRPRISEVLHFRLFVRQNGCLSVGLLGKLQFVFTPRIVTVILILIAFTLTPVILKLVLGDAVHTLFNLFFTLVMVLALVIGNKLLRGIWKSTTVLWGIVGGVLVYYGVFGFPTLVSTGAGIIPEQATVFNFPLNFEAGTILAFLFYQQYPYLPALHRTRYMHRPNVEYRPR